MSNPVCAVIGVGPGNGTAIARKFSSEGYKIALLSRNEDYLNELAHECGDARAYVYDALDTTAPEKVFGKIKQELGSVDVLTFGQACETVIRYVVGSWLRRCGTGTQSHGARRSAYPGDADS